MAQVLCGTPEGFEGSKKAIVNFKEVMYEGKPALLVVDTEQSVIQKNAATIKSDGKSIISIAGTQQPQQDDAQQPPQDDAQQSQQDGAQQPQQDDAQQDDTTDAKPMYTANQLAVAFNAEYEHSTCTPFKDFMDDPSLSISDVTIAELLPDYEKFEIDSNVEDTLQSLNKARGDKLASCRETFGKVLSAFDTFATTENLMEYEKKPSGKGCGVYAALTFNPSEKNRELKKISQQFDTPEYDEFRNSILKREMETMKMVDEKYKACLMKFVMRPMDKVKILSDRQYMHYDGNLGVGGGRRYAQSWRMNDVFRDDTNDKMGVMIKSDNDKGWQDINGKCITLKNDGIDMEKCDSSNEKQIFTISEGNNSTVCHYKEDMCLKKEGKSVVGAPLQKNNSAFEWMLRKTY